MKRGDLYRLRHPGGGDPKKQRVMTVVSRQTLVDSRFPTDSPSAPKWRNIEVTPCARRGVAIWLKAFNKG